MKDENQIKEKIAEHQKWIDEMLNRKEERDISFWLDLQRLRIGQKALEWVLSSENYIEETEIDKMIRFEEACIYGSKIF